MANVEKFRYWCNKILPLVYDDSLSYYEFLGKVYEKLNETIDAVNSNTEAVAEFDQRINDFIAAETLARESWEDQQERDRQSWETQQAQKWSAFQAMFISEYDPDDAYVKGDLCSVQYKMYVANASTTGAFDPTKWDEIVLSDYLAEYISTAAAAMQTQYDAFLAAYQAQFGVVQNKGTSTTDVMSQNAVSNNFNGIISNGAVTLTLGAAGFKNVPDNSQISNGRTVKVSNLTSGAINVYWIDTSDADHLLTSINANDDATFPIRYANFKRLRIYSADGGDVSVECVDRGVFDLTKSSVAYSAGTANVIYNSSITSTTEGNNILYDFVVTPGRQYKFTNAGVTLNIKYSPWYGSTTDIYSGLANGDSVIITAPADCALFTVYKASGSASFTIEPMDDGIYKAAADTKNLVGKQNGIIKRASAGQTTKEMSLYKGRKYTVSTTVNTNFSVVDANNDATMITDFIGAGNSYTFICPLNAVKIRAYMTGSGTVTIESTDSGVFDAVEKNIDEKIGTYDYTTVALFKNIAVIGDSYSSGAIYNGDDEHIFDGHTGRHNEMSWLSIMARRNGCTPFIYAYPGATCKSWLASTGDYGLQKLQSDDAHNLYFIMLGINDDQTLGSIADCYIDYTQNADTFYGNYGRIIGNVQTKAPAGKIVCIIPPLTDKGAAIRSVAEFYGVPVFSGSGSAYMKSTFYTSNLHNLHPIGITYAGMAVEYEKQLSMCIQNNAEYFTTYWGND